MAKKSNENLSKYIVESEGRYFKKALDGANKMTSDKNDAKEFNSFVGAGLYASCRFSKYNVIKK